jgi:signal transduction histidine kinase
MNDHDLAGRRLLAVTEEELQRVVLDIHDGPVQNLFAALGQLSVLRARLEAPDAPGVAGADYVPPLTRAVKLLEASLGEIRDIVGTLHAPAFTERELGEIAENLVVQHETLTGGAVRLDVAPSLPRVSPLVKIALYRILQEALSNIRRHAGAPDASVRLWAADDLVHIEIEDQGRGFEPPPLVGPDATEREMHIGLRGMRERASLVNGELRVESKLGAGTRVRVQVPRA